MSSHQPNWIKNDKWLHEQSLVSHSLLLGRGIVCGLQPKFDEKDCTLWLCGGTGVTSDGILVQLPEQQYHFTHYTIFDPPDYFLFQHEEKQKYPVWELLIRRKGDGAHEVKALTPQSPREALTPFLAEKVLIIFLEPLQVPTDQKLQKEPTETGVSVQGVPENSDPDFPPQFKYRFLLMRQQDVISQEGLNTILQKIIGSKNLDADFVYSDEYSLDDDRPDPKDLVLAQKPELVLAEIPLRRFGFGCLDPFDCQPEELEASQFPHIQNLDDIYNTYVCIIDAATRALDKEMRKLHKLLTAFYACRQIKEAEDILDQLCAKWELFKKLNTLKDTSRHRKENVQYFYDWCRDLLAAYHELRRHLFELVADCQPDQDRFPRHLLLGLVMHSPWANYPNPLRHYFRQPPIYNDNAKRLEEVRHQHLRFLLLIKGFYLPYSLPDQLLNPYCEMEEAGEDEELPNMTDIKVTPGYYYDTLLEQQTIPYYYPLTESRFSVHRFWSYFKSSSLTEDRQLSYHAHAGEDSYTRHPSIIRPLRYNIDRMPFYRIEGHIGQPKGETIAKLAKWQRKFNLSFDILYRSVDQLTEASVTLDGETFNTFLSEIQGAEHLAGVLAGGTFIVVYEADTDKVIADFSLPYRCCGQKAGDDIEQPPATKKVSGEVIDCQNKNPLPGIKVILGDESTSTDSAGRFSANLTSGSYKIAIVSDLHLPVNQELVIAESDSSKNLGTFLLRPRVVTVQGAIVRGDTALKGAAIVIKTADGKAFETISDDKGNYSFSGIARGQGQLNYQISGLGGDLSILVDPECDMFVVPTINISNAGNGLQPFPNNFRAINFLNDRYYEAVGINPQSTNAKELQTFYDDRITKYVVDFVAVRKAEKVNDLEGFKATETAIAQIINDPDLSTNQLHRTYKSAVAALEIDLKSAKAADKKLLLAGAEALNQLYLYRIALNQPDSLTAGTDNALKEANTRGLSMDKSLKVWLSETKEHIAPGLRDDLSKWKPS